MGMVIKSVISANWLAGLAHNFKKSFNCGAIN